MFGRTGNFFWKRGMNTLTVETAARAESVVFTQDEMIVSLVDGRRIAVPLAWFPRLAEATPTQLENWQLLGDGEGIHWPDLDEDISVPALLRG